MGPSTSPFRFESPQQQLIYDRLCKLVGPGPGAYFVDACRLMSEDTGLQSSTHLVAHLLREIESAVRDVLETLTSRQKRAQDRTSAHRNEIVAILESLGVQSTEAWAAFWLELPGSNEGLHARAHRRDLAPPRPLDSTFRSFWAQMLIVLDRVLDGFEAGYVAVFTELDGLLTIAAPASAQIKKLREKIPNSYVAFHYFFSRLTNPAWLPLLAEAGFFKDPPPAVVNELEGTIGYVHWPLSDYLSRMALAFPTSHPQISEVLLQIPETDNLPIHHDLIAIACELPVDDAAAWIEREIEWLNRQQRLAMITARLGTLINHLCAGGRVATAIRVTETLLTVFPDSNLAVYEQTAIDGLRQMPRIKTRLDAAAYRELLETCIPVLSEAVPWDTAKILVQVLAAATSFSVRAVMQDGDEDLSLAWRPAVENHPQNHGFDIKDFLVTAIRDTFCKICEAAPSEVHNVIAFLDTQQYRIFRRLSFYLLQRFSTAAPDLVSARLTNRLLFDQLDHEFFNLLKQDFARLSSTDQNTVLDFIRSGGKVEEGDQEFWRMRRMAAISEYLPPDMRSQWDDYCDRHPLPRHPDFSAYHEGGFIVPTSPLAVDEIMSMTIPGVIAYLREFIPSDSLFDDSRTGLSSALADAVTKDPTKYAHEVIAFKEISGDYLSALLRGFITATRTDNAFRWDGVLELCHWIATRHLTEGPATDTPDSRWMRKLIVDLCDAGLQKGVHEIPFALRRVVWETLVPLTLDSDPTPERELRDIAEQQMDAFTLAINTVRGWAIHVVIRYANWVKRHSNEETLEHNHEFMPEVWPVLEAHLDPSKDPSRAVRAVYGEWFPWLHVLDPTWTEQFREAIFPQDLTQRTYWSAAWDTYVCFCDPYLNIWPVLQTEYIRAVELIGERGSNRSSARDPDDKLAEHLMFFYYRGRCDLVADGIIQRFFERASDVLRGHALATLGQVLGEVETIPPATLERLRRLWEARLSAARAASDIAFFKKELSQFGGWFASGQFDDEWSLSQLEIVLSLVGIVEPDHLVLAQLSARASTMPEEAVHCLSMLIAGDHEGWRIHAWESEARSILQTVLASGHNAAITSATSLINRIVARGHQSFRNLLS